MSTTEPSQERTLGQLVAAASQDLGTILRGEIALAKSEVSGQFKKAGLGGALLAAAGVLAFYSVYFVFITIAEGITAAGLPKWLSYLIVTAFFILVAGLLGFIGIRRLKKVKPKPQRAIAQAQQTVAALKSAAANPYPGSAAATTIAVPTAGGTNVGPGSAGGTTVRTTDLSDLGQTARDAISNDAVGGPAKSAPTAPASTKPSPAVESLPAASTAATPAVETTPAQTSSAPRESAAAAATEETAVPRTRAEAKAAQQHRTDPPRDA